MLDAGRIVVFALVSYQYKLAIEITLPWSDVLQQNKEKTDKTRSMNGVEGRQIKPLVDFYGRHTAVLTLLV